MKKLPSTSKIVPEQKWTATGMESLVNPSGVVVVRPTQGYKPNDELDDLAFRLHHCLSRRRVNSYVFGRCVGEPLSAELGGC